MGCLVAVFVVTLLFNLRIVAKSKVIDLMSSQRGHEELKLRNPWVSAILCIVGLVLMGIAYIRLSHDKIPLRLTDDWGAFLLTTALVVAGTVLFFFGLSGLLLKILQAVRGIYWRGLNMFTLRELSVRINTVSMSMAVISLILFFCPNQCHDWYVDGTSQSTRESASLARGLFTHELLCLTITHNKHSAQSD